MKERLTTVWKIACFWNFFFERWMVFLFSNFRFVVGIFSSCPEEKFVYSCLFVKIGDPSVHLYKLSFISFRPNEFNHWARILLFTYLIRCYWFWVDVLKMFNCSVWWKFIRIQIDIIYGEFTTVPCTFAQIFTKLYDLFDATNLFTILIFYIPENYATTRTFPPGIFSS